MDRVAAWLARHPRRVVVATLLVTAVLGIFAVRVRVESSLESVLPAGDPAVAFYDEVRRQFGSDDVGVVGVIADDVFAIPTLEKIARVTAALGKLPGVQGVISITNTKDVAEDVINPPPLLPRMPPSPDEVAALRAKLVAVPLYRENLVASDGKGAAINVSFSPMSDARYADLGLDRKIEQVLAAEQGPERLYYTSAAHVKQAAVELMQRDLVRFTPIALLVVVFSLWLSFRTKRGVLLPLAAVSIALICTVGVLVLTGRAISLGTFVLPPLLLVVGTSYAIHVMARYYEQSEEGTERIPVIERAYARVWLPLSISALVTVVGFGSLMVSRIRAIWELGAFAVVGVLFVAIVCLTFLPAALALLPVERVARRARDGSPALSGMLDRLARAVACSPRPIWWLAAALAVIALLGMRRIEVDSDFLTYFSPRSAVRQANEIINREVVGSNPFYVVVEGPEAGSLKRWTNLWLMKDLQQYLRTLPGISSSVSIVDYLELLESGLNTPASNDLQVNEKGEVVAAEKPRPFWQDPSNLDPVLKLVSQSPETFSGFVTRDFDKASILVRTTLSGSRSIEQTLTKIREYVANHFPAELRVRLTGNLVLLTGTTSEIVAGQVKSLALALGVIFLVLTLMFLSIRIGFMAILPNVLPILIFFGVMGILGIRLNLGTSLIAAIALGIAIDSTIHYMARLNQELRGETDQQAAITRALRRVGAPIIYTTVALALGFLTFAFSSFVPIQDFGRLSSITMATALGANLVLLPALLAQFKIITLWDLLGVKLGEEPAHTIPLFAGLRPSQARVVVLMGDLKRFQPGQVIVRRGERGDEMYVMIQGRVEVWIGGDHGRHRIVDMKRGDVFGEMGLVRGGNERTADVVAASDVEVLAVDERFLRRIQSRYPRIASKVLLNLSRILSDRLQQANVRFLEASTG
ncbi:MAG TPA: MMPL family transporter [Candidatus Binatia bacterium]|nr:MMPL family transporter [Candidatus Binatia bacterium]